MNFARAYNPIRSLRTSWHLLRRSPLPLGIGALALIGFDWLTGYMILRLEEEPWPWSPSGRLVVSLAGVAISFLFVSLFTLGFANALEKTITSGRARITDLFDTRGRYAAMLGTYLALRLGFYVSSLPFDALMQDGKFLRETLHIPSSVTQYSGVAVVIVFAALLWVWLGLALWTQVVAFEGGTPWAVMKRSWQLVRGHRLQLVLFLVVVFAAMIVGVIGCIVGVLVTFALGHVALYESYLALTRPDERVGSWLTVAPIHPPALDSAVVGAGLE